MTAEEFEIFWKSTYPDTVPVAHHFRHDYSHRWFRIHSLPDSQRYPSNQEDWEILLARQNTILNDLLANESPILIVTEDDHPDLPPIDKVKSIQSFTFTRLEPIDLYLHSRKEYEKGVIYTPMFTEQIWYYDKFTELIKDIAEWKLVAFFISIENNCIVAPYDGGMDIILKDSQTRDFYKAKYERWLSPRNDGL
jgi:hypothetical protein